MVKKCEKKNEAVFVGIDPSLTGTGLIVLDQNACIMEEKLIQTTNKDVDEARFVKIMKALDFIKNIIRLECVYVEGPAYGSRGNAALQLGALHYLIRIFLYKNSLPYKIIAPKSLKLFHTGRGDTKKSEIVKIVNERYGTKFNNHNLSDAYGLARMALEDYKDEL